MAKTKAAPAVATAKPKRDYVPLAVCAVDPQTMQPTGEWSVIHLTPSQKKQGLFHMNGWATLTGFRMWFHGCSTVKGAVTGNDVSRAVSLDGIVATSGLDV